MSKDKNYYLDTTPEIKKWNIRNRSKRKMTEKSLSEKVGTTPQSLIRMKGKQVPKWVSKVNRLLNLVPMGFMESIIEIKDTGKKAWDYEIIKALHNQKHIEDKKISIAFLIQEFGLPDSNYVDLLFKICKELECEPKDIIFEKLQ